ncbi:hypothetical protein JTE90_017949 [Oedothorax gibbosus]|uniref:Maturase K n=1 Tax=Oedothorax gibbosus TaxID=931172 RepID=A0AAV6V6W7_9ARAC|nr:hypothetical protein JTE90_017949 [Oedothorax gibbosus]
MSTKENEVRLVKYRENWWNTQTEKERIDVFERNIVHYLLEICFWMSYEDSDVVSNLLSILYDTDEHFEELFGVRRMRLLDLKKYALEDLVTFVGYPWSNNGERKYGLCIRYRERIRYLDFFPCREQEPRINYFIKHGFKKKLFFLQFGEHWLRNKIKKVDNIFSKRHSVFFTDPDILSKFLEYGLFSNANKHDESVGGLITSIVAILYS